ncbi:MAG: porin [Gammaproteobacteria bacterium]|nr:porin [Gammaproteobacteria bacterium]
MKKTLIASAIAAATFVSAANAADNLPEVYGNIQLVWAYQHVNNGGSVSGLYDNFSTIGFKHSHEIAPGIKGFMKAEMEFNADDKRGSNGLDRLDEAYIGIEGEMFGKIWAGSDDSTYEAAVDEIYNYFEFISQNIRGPYDTGEGDLVQYSSPSFGGLKLHGAVQVNGDGDKAGQKSYPYQLAATFEMDMFEFALAMDSNDGDYGYSSHGVNSSTNNENTYGVRASANMGDLRVTGQVQSRKDVGDLYGLFAKYSMGKTTFAAAYEFAEEDATNGVEVDVLSAQVLHNLSDNMYVYVEGHHSDSDQGGPDARDVAIGAVYAF